MASELGNDTHNTPSISGAHTPTISNPKVLAPGYTPIPNFHFPITPSSTHAVVPLSSGTTFEDLLQAAELDLPPPGPSYYAARRALWLTPRSPPQPRIPEPSTSRRRLEKLLSAPEAVNDDDAWASGIEKVWKSLSAGGRLKRRLPMNLVMKIIHSAWLRDDTWPTGAVAPEPDDVLLDIPEFTWKCPLPSTGPTEHSSGVTSPWMVVSGADEALVEVGCAAGLVAATDHR